MAGQTSDAASDAKGSTPPHIPSGQQTTPARAHALRSFASLVEEGVAEFRRSADGESELRLATGEVYRLDRNTVRRIA
jgi:hypothetical protein